MGEKICFECFREKHTRFKCGGNGCKKHYSSLHSNENNGIQENKLEKYTERKREKSRDS